jgi:hypothetical protein
MRVLSDSAGDLFGFSSNDLEIGVQKFASGVLAPAIWEGYRKAGTPMCISASEANNAAVERACRFVQAGGQLLLDSGAFVYRDNPDNMPWERILAVYETVTQAASARVTVTLPDVVGSQEGTLAALRLWGNKVMAAIGSDHEALLPVQSGPKSPAAFVREAVMCLERSIGGLALPSNAAAFPAENIRQLADMPAEVPHRLHFLGISRNSRRLQDRVFRLKAVWPDAQISCDAVEHRSLIGVNRPITASRAAALASMWDEELNVWDDTEDQEADTLVLASMRTRFPYLDEDQLSAMLCTQLGGWTELQSKHERHAKEKGPAATTESIYAYASGALDAS